MALLRRGSSRISEENFNHRLQREKAKTGAITASLAWNDPSDLDLHAHVVLKSGEIKTIYYRNKRDFGGYLDVDMHACDRNIVDEPVENIFWKKPPAGVYTISVHLYRKRGVRQGDVPFRALLKREGEEDKSVEGALGSSNTSINVFTFTVDGDADVTLSGDADTPAAPKAKVAMKAMAAMRAMVLIKAMAKAKPKRAPMKKVSQIAKGKKRYVQIYRGLKIKTTKGLRKDDLVKSKGRKIVSAKKSALGKDSKWAKATARARAEKGYVGFKAIKKGTSFYEKAKEILATL